MTESTPQSLGRYTIRAEIGRGGFATVYRALDTSLDREVALKVLHPQLLTDRSFAERFRKEARALASLRHPHIVTVYEVGEAEGRLYIAMELAKGASLAQAIAERRRIPWTETVALLKPVCEALDYAHVQGIVHRDLKPANILLDKERGALLTDFGFARLMGESSVSMSLSGGVMGTPAYIAPEVWEQLAAKPAADIYALGCIVFEMLTGQVLFAGKTPMQAMRAHDKGPQFPSAWPEGVPAGVDAVLRQALARQPAARHPSATALWHALNDLEVDTLAQREKAERAAVAAQWRTETEAALAAGEWSAARMAVGRWLAVAPDDQAALTMRQEIDRRESGARAKTEAEQRTQREAQERQQWETKRKAAQEAERKAREEQARQAREAQERQERERQTRAQQPPWRTIPVWMWLGGLAALVACVVCVVWLFPPTPPPTPAPTAPPPNPSTATNTPVPPSPTWTNTPVSPSPTPTNTPVPPSPTWTNTPTPRPVCSGAPMIGAFTGSPAAITAGNSATLSWAVTNAEAVEVDNVIGRVATSGSTRVSPRTTTTYTLVARCGTNIATRQVTIMVNTPTPETPAIPSSFKAVGTDTTIQFTWNDNSTNEVGFRIYQVGVVAPVAALGAHTGTGGISYNWTGRPCNTSATFLVKAYNSAGESNQSSTDSADTIPCAPTGFSTTGASQTQVNVSFADNATNESGFRIYRSGSSTALATLSAQSGTGGKTGAVGSIPCGTTYTYYVQAYNSAGESASSNTNAGTTSGCTVTINFTSVHIYDDEDPTASGELSFDFNVNGNTRRWPSSGTVSASSGDDKTISGFSLTLALLRTQTLSISVKGTDHDTPPFDPDDSLGTAATTYTSATAWGEGSRCIESASPHDFRICYTINVTP